MFVPVAAVPDPDSPDAPRRLPLPRGAAAAPLYRQVCDQIEALAMSAPLGDETPLPPESQLLSRFGVSRGTLRRATEELARQGLLRIEPGRGTFVVHSTKVRWTVWDRLLEIARPDSRFDLDVSKFVPDFAGRERCDKRVLALPQYKTARTVFLAPDNSLEQLRLQALADGKRLLVPSYGLRRGFLLLDGAAIPAADRALAATLDGMERFGSALTLPELRAIEPVDLVVSGAVAVTRRGLHFGGGQGFFDLEWALMRHCGLVTSQTPVVVVVHECQVLDAEIRPAPHDAVADIVVTPSALLTCSPALPKPDGIFWDEIQATRTDAVPYVRDLLAELHPPLGTTRPRSRWQENP